MAMASLNAGTPQKPATGLRSQRLLRAVKWSSFLLLGASALCLAYLLPVDLTVQRLQAWVDGAGAFGPVVFGLVYFVAVLLMLPASLLTIAAGALFGLVLGTVTVSLASTLAVACAFLISRHLARGKIERRLRSHERFSAVDHAIGEGGWRIVALLRLSPAIPFGLQNYLYGLTAVRFWPCVLASWLAMLPGTFLYVYIGVAGRAGVLAVAGSEDSWGAGRWTMLVIGLAATIAVTIYLTVLARRAMARQGGKKIEPAQEDDSAKKSQPLPWWPTLILAGCAVTMAVLAVIAYLEADRIRSWFGSSDLEERHQPAPRDVRVYHGIQANSSHGMPL